MNLLKDYEIFCANMITPDMGEEWSKKVKKWLYDVCNRLSNFEVAIKSAITNSFSDECFCNCKFCKIYTSWADNWLTGKDRTEESAKNVLNFKWFNTEKYSNIVHATVAFAAIYGYLPYKKGIERWMFLSNIPELNEDGIKLYLWQVELFVLDTFNWGEEYLC